MNVITNNPVKCNIALASLQHVTDPEIGLNVVDLGLIYQVDFDEELRRIYAEMTLTTQFCPMGESIVDGVTNALQTTFGDDHVQVVLTFEPAWNSDRISEEGRLFLDQ